jgi:hypothetical protein
LIRPISTNAQRGCGKDEENFMRATIMYEAGDVRIENVSDPKIIEPTDALISYGHRAMDDREAIKVMVKP